MTKTVYILLFRGVGGATQLPVKPLREKLTEAGFKKVATYINSGNALLASGKGRETVRKEVAAICKAEFGFDKDIHVVTREEWAELIAKNPFPGAAEVPKFLHAAVLAGDPPKGAVEKLREVAKEGERIEVVDRVAYLHTPHGFGTSKLAEKFDKGIGVANTARNWNTVAKLMEMAEGM
ncbi:DUF1697 domain-containing protein [Mesorhizobium australicum]|uniref:Uncharacterized conserved protein, DUF1697 family n=1 Tax=Mesorhizobium australicum TaxID=536018 RepID=A0A1X7PFJ3_9HYPH|nr:DUF1697 domain-containing protein [Mesorhizobium australicum]SMH49547.1 Uncharacterized conserved protein, DUF1697 family [Mesorhizobium australicum]